MLESATRHSKAHSLDRLMTKAFSVVAKRKMARKTVRTVYRLIGAFSAKTGFDPIVELSLKPLGIDARFRLYLLRRDLTFLFQSFVLHVYEKYCKLELGDVVVDCGAYVGDFTARASKLVGPKGLVLAFEPNPRSYSLCAWNVSENGLMNVKLYNVALGERRTSASLEVDEINPAMTRVIDKTFAENDGSVPVKPLSEFLTILEDRPIKLLKMHVEGDAVKILTSSPELLKKKLFQNICVELHPGEEALPSLLKRYGYRCIVEGVYLYATAESPVC